MSISVSGMRGGQPSTTQPIAGPWLSPKVVTRNKWPNVLCDIAKLGRKRCPFGTNAFDLMGAKRVWNKSRCLSRGFLDFGHLAGLRLGRRSAPFRRRWDLFAFHHQGQRAEPREIGHMRVVEHGRAGANADAAANMNATDLHHAIFVK